MGEANWKSVEGCFDTKGAVFRCAGDHLPFNILAGIPIYYEAARWLAERG